MFEKISLKYFIIFSNNFSNIFEHNYITLKPIPIVPKFDSNSFFFNFKLGASKYPDFFLSMTTYVSGVSVTSVYMCDCLFVIDY